MVKFDPTILLEEDRKRLLEEFYKAATLIEDYEEAKLFFKDLLTPKETAMLARRLQVAALLIEGCPYEEIIDLLKVGKTTIANVQKWLTLGGEGYRLILKRLAKHHAKVKKVKEALQQPFSWASFKRKYAGHFVLEEAMKDLEKSLKKRRKRKSLPKKDC